MVSFMSKRQCIITALVVLLILLVGLLPPQSSALAQSAVALDTTSGPPGTEVTATGSGWSAGHEVSVQWGGAQLATTDVDDNGGFTVSFTVPDDAAEGQHTVYFVDVPPDGGLGYFIPATFTVTASSEPPPPESEPTISLDPTEGPPGTEVTVQGSGWIPGYEGDTVELYFTVNPEDSWYLLGETTVGNDGTFTATVTIPADAAIEEYYILAIIPEVRTATAFFQVTESTGEPTCPEPTVTVSASSGKPGDTITVQGEDWLPGGTVTVVLVEEPAQFDVGSVSVPDSGAWESSFTLPDAPPSVYWLAFIENHAGCELWVEEVFTIAGEAETDLAANAGPDQTVPGPSPVAVQFDGSGSTGDIVRYQWYNQYGLLLAEEVTPVIEVNFGKDKPQPGTQRTFTLVVEDSQGNTAEDQVTITLGETEAADTEPPTVSWVKPVGNRGVYPAANGTVELEVSATDNSGIQSVEFYHWDAVNSQFIGITTDPSPPYQASVEVNTLNMKWNQIGAIVTDTAGNKYEDGIFIYRLAPAITLDPTQVSHSRAVTVQGSGWFSGDTVIISLADPANTVTQATADTEGNFETTFTVPANAAFGEQKVIAITADGTWGAETIFRVTEPEETPTPTPTPVPTPTPTATPTPTPTPTTFDLSITQTVSPDPVLVGQELTYILTVTNKGPNPATGVTLTVPLPAATVYQIHIFPIAWNCTTPAVGSTGTVTCTVESLASNAHAQITIFVKAIATGTITNTASVNANGSDTNMTDNTASINTTVQTSPRRQLIIFLQGILTDLSVAEANRGEIVGMDRVDDTVREVFPEASTEPDASTRLLQYSYFRSRTDNGLPVTYSCADTITNSIVDDIRLLDRQIENAFKEQPDGAEVDIYLIGHSLGGAVALAYVDFLQQELEENGNKIVSLPTNAHLKAVITLDSPLGGHRGFPPIIENFIAGRCPNLRDSDPRNSPRDLQEVFNSIDETLTEVDETAPRGARASFLTLHRGEPNWEIFTPSNGSLTEAAQIERGTSFLSIGNINDLFLTRCRVDPADAATQFLEDEGDGKGLYGREFETRTSDCGDDLPEAQIRVERTHTAVLEDEDVQEAIKNFLNPIADGAVGGTPNPLEINRYQQNSP